MSMQTLPSHWRNYFRLDGDPQTDLYSGMTGTEIADRLGATIPVVRSWRCANASFDLTMARCAVTRNAHTHERGVIAAEIRRIEKRAGGNICPLLIAEASKSKHSLHLIALLTLAADKLGA